MTRFFELKTIFVVVAVSILGILPWQSAAGESLDEGNTQSVANLSTVSELFADHIHPNVLARADIDTSGIGPTLHKIVESQAQLAKNEQLVAELATQLQEQITDRKRLVQEVATASDEFDAVTAAGAQAREEISALAIASFQNPTHSRALEYVATGEINSDTVLVRQGTDQMKASYQDLVDDKQLKGQRHKNLAAALAETLEAIIETERDMGTSKTQIESAQQTITQLTPQLVSKVLLAPLADLPFPVVVLDAYYKAQLSTAATQPNCQVSWSQLAGIGKVETIHGTYGSAVVTHDGKTSSKILGPQLDGDPFLAIPDSDGGQLDGNPVWDHAVGPMQFIPTSWSIYGADGNNDQVQDPHNMYDAALAAANHLCGSKKQLATPVNFTRALLGYNRSVSYGNEVKRYVAEYSAVLDLPG